VALRFAGSADDGRQRIQHGKTRVAAMCDRRPTQHEPYPAWMVTGVPRADIVPDVAVVRSMLSEQHPDLAHLPVTALAAGWDNAMFRVGDDLLLRIPVRQSAAELIVIEQRWLPLLNERLAAAAPSIQLPSVRRIGVGGKLHPWNWSVLDWIDGQPLADVAVIDEAQLARDLGAFIAELRQPAPSDAPVNPLRGLPLNTRHEMFIAHLSDAGPVLARELGVSVETVAQEWGSARTAPSWDGPPQWIHGDIHPRNLLVRNGYLAAVIDFGDMAGGDPAYDGAMGWWLHIEDDRMAFLRAADFDAATTERSRAWAIAYGVAMLACSAHDDWLVDTGARLIRGALA